MSMASRWLRACRTLMVVTLMAVAPLPALGIAVAQDAVEAPAGAAEQVTVSDPLPAPDFSMAYRHVFLAFALAWILMLVYAVWIRRGMGEMEREIERLGG